MTAERTARLYAEALGLTIAREGDDLVARDASGAIVRCTDAVYLGWRGLASALAMEARIVTPSRAVAVADAYVTAHREALRAEADYATMLAALESALKRLQCARLAASEAADAMRAADDTLPDARARMVFRMLCEVEP